MAAIKTINFLPAVFRTDTNQKFLNATLDQLSTPPDLRNINAYVGRKFAPTFKTTDNYQPEPTQARQNYQLEPSVVVKNSAGDINFFSSYLDLLQQIDHEGGITTNQSRMFANESYNFNGLFDFDKFVNFTQYYWLPNGPDTVQVYGSGVDTLQTYTVTRDPSTGSYHFSGSGTQQNPTLRLAHGGTYKFVVNQPGYPFWIQTEAGTSGVKANQANFSSRDILGVENNGTDVGTITFSVPNLNSQDWYLQMPKVTDVDLATEVSYTQIEGQPLSTVINLLGGIDGIKNQLIGKTIIFVNQDIDDSLWTVNDVTVPVSKRRNAWTMRMVPGTDANPIIFLDSAYNVSINERVYVKSGLTRAEYSFYLDSDSGTYKQVPDITSALSTLYYQDGVSSTLVGQLRLLSPTDNTIDIENEILGRPGYTSPNGVVFTNGLKITFDSNVIPTSYAGNTYYIEGVGSSIRLLLESEFFTNTAFNTQDYITINRASRDLNPWTRSNRWFHGDVITAAAGYNEVVPVFDQAVRATRPIIEFEADLQLYNFGREAKTPIDVFSNDGSVTDARTTIELSSSAIVDGVALEDGMRVVFADDLDPTVRNQIFVVNIESIAGVAKINLVPADDYLVSPNNNLIVLQGTNKNIEFWYDGSSWHEGQQKTSVNQSPVFDVFDVNGYSLSDTSKYPSTTFAGTKIFSYQEGTGTVDTVLGFPLSYRNFNQIGDIQFDNNFDGDTFTYSNGTSTVTSNVNGGLLRQNSSLTEHTVRNTWTTSIEPSQQNQIISGVYDGIVRVFEIDITASAADKSVPHFRVYINSKLVDDTKYALVSYGVKNYVNITDTTLTKGDRIDILIYSTSVSSLGYYEVPKNLDLNTENKNFTSLTLGQLRNHLATMAENNIRIVGPVPGNSNLRDTPIKEFSGSIVQHASPLLYSELFLVDPEVNFMKGVDLARHEYSKIKNKILELSGTASNVDINDIPATLDTLLNIINSVKNKSFAWYYSDMVPYGSIKNTLTYTVLSQQIRNYEITNIFSDTELSGQAVLVYVNNVQLIKGIDYTFEAGLPGITILDSYTINIGDVITINEYSSTDGNYIPETPTKLGLYPKFKPEIYVDDTYATPTTVIVGHDGSITPAFGDYRDDLLLEFEKRIYNNIKVDYARNVFDVYNFLPGKFRTTDYTNAEFNKLLTKSFLKWTGSNRVDFTDNSYFVSTNPFTWNYRLFRDSLTGEQLPGTWRAIFNYWYDTDRPHTHPWEMLGFSEKPSWWEARYGAAPYTGGNLVLWNDLSKGYIHAGDRAGYDTRFARPNLLKVIPVDDHGALRPPTEFATAGFNSNDANISYAVGDQGPVETAWRRSSDYPYAVQQAIALSHPAFYFGTLMNVGRYYKNTDLNQYVLTDTLQRITPTAIPINGDATGAAIARAAGYVNWVAEHLRNQGIDPVVKISEYLTDVTVQLAYKMAGYSDQKMLEVIAEQSSPTSTNQGVVIPNENYDLHLHKSTPIGTIAYSAVIVEKSDNGYTVSGYDTDNPYFTIIPSLANNNAYSITVLNDVAVVYNDYQPYKVTVPYGFEFTNKQQVVDFLISYERYLRGIGMNFTQFDADLEVPRDFKLSVREFLSWSQQGWTTGNLIVLSPVLNKITLTTTSGVVDEVKNQPGASRVLDANFNFIRSNHFTVTRNENRFSLTANLGQTIALALFDVVEYEHVLIFDNATVFNDIIYKPELGNRQYRLKLVGKKTGSWTGNLNPPGFIYNSPVVEEWSSGVDYKKGTLVSYKTLYYTASTDLVASNDFIPSQWTRVSGSEIKTGLLPNFSYNAEKFNRFNDVDNPETEGNFDQYSTGAIGFRPRQFMTDFGISATTQAKFYQGYIKEKGTINAVDAFTAAGFNGVTSTINLYEEWAMRVGEYGALDNNKFAEVTLVEGQFTGDPTTFTLLPNGGVATDNIIGVQPQDLYRKSEGYQPNIFKNRDASSIYENDIHTSGYVNENDVDATIFDLATYSELNYILSQIKIGYKIWCAKDLNGAWNVYRVSETNTSITAISYNVDNTAKVTTNVPHTFSVGDIIVIKGFDGRFDAFYQVYSLVDAYNFNVAGTLNLETLTSLQTVTGFGPIYKLQSVRVSTPVDLNSVTPSQEWRNNDKLWVDDNGFGTWAVYNKSTPWTANLDINNTALQLDANSYVTNSGFGTEATISADGSFSAAGVPNVLNGNVMAFVANVTNGNVLTFVANIGTDDGVTGFGTALASAGNLLYIGAPGTVASQSGNVYIYQFDGNVTFTKKSTITGANVGGQFGSSISASADGTWLFVGAPGATDSTVYVYHGNAITGTYTLANTIAANVAGSNISAQFGYTVKTTSDASQTIISAPYERVNGVSAAGAVYVYDRSVETFIATGSTTYTTEYPMYTANARVAVNGNVITSGYSFTNGTNTLTFSPAPVIGSKIVVDTNRFQLLEKLVAPTQTSGAAFGVTAHISGNDADIYVASPGYSEPGYHSGIVYRFVNQGATYGEITSTLYDPAVTTEDSIRINGQLVSFTGGNVTTIISDINSAGIPGVTVTTTNAGTFQIVSNVQTANERLVITPSSANAFANLGLSVYSIAQTIRHPGTDAVNLFGSQVVSSNDANVLVISASAGATYNTMTFDEDTTAFDTFSTQFSDSEPGSGVVYVYGLVGGALSGTAQDQYVLVQRLENKNLSSNDQFGSSLAMNQNTILVGAPGDSNHYIPDVISESPVAVSKAGTYYAYDNFSGNIGWDIVSSEMPKVDIGTISRMYLYDTVTNTILTNLDFIDPAKGKILGVADQDIDYRTSYDPATYNTIGGNEATPTTVGYNIDYYWGKDQVGQTWWDLDKVRFVDYEQGNLIYRASAWGDIFPGSTIEISEWVESDYLPSQYAGDGTPKYADNAAYTVQQYVDPATKVIRSKYYFWVNNKTSVDVTKTNRKNTISTLQDIIANPKTQGIPYAAVLSDNTISLYGVTGYITGTLSGNTSVNTTVLHIDYDTLNNTNVIHSEYQIVQEGNSESAVPDRIITKIKDSLAGIAVLTNPAGDEIVLPVPDPTLPFQSKIGIGIKPQQTVFIDQRKAIENFVKYVNDIFVTTPIVEEFIIDRLYTAEPIPTSSNYDLTVASYAELGYVNTDPLSVGYKALVTIDETQQNLWAIYNWTGTEWTNTQTQSYYTPFYWTTTDWYDSSYDSTVKPTYVVNTVNDLQKLTPSTGQTAKVLNNGRGQFEVYRYDSSSSKSLVGIENGTIQLTSNLYTNTTIPSRELRIIFEALENDIFIGTLKSNFNTLFFYMVNYILTEQKSVDWVFKTSFVSIVHQLRKLEQFPNYIRDNQTYYEDYINEVKPYRTKLREYLLDYQGSDEFQGDITDFDLPAFYSNVNKTYRSPDGTLTNDSTDLATKSVYNQWYTNHTYGVESVDVANPGSGYTIAPSITIVGGGGSGAVVEAIIDGFGSIIEFNVIKQGSGYTSQPTVVVNGNGTGGAGYARLVNKHYIKSLPTQVISTVTDVTITAGNIITQPNTGASGTAYISSTGNAITVVDVVGTFTSNDYLFSDNANLEVRAGIPSDTITVETPVTVTIGDVVTQPASGASGEVFVSSTGNVITLWNTVGTFILDDYVYNNAANLSVVTTATDVLHTDTSPVSNYTQFINQSYNTVRTFNETIKFDRVSYTSNVVTWANNTAYTATIETGDVVGNVWLSSGNLVAYNNQLYLPVNADVTTDSVFDYDRYQLIDAGNVMLTTNDRIMAYYQPTVTMPSKDLAKLVYGIDYPGVIIDGVKFNTTTSNISSNVVYMWANVSSLYSSDTSVLDFTTVGYEIGQPIKVVNTDTGYVGNLTIADITSNIMLLAGTTTTFELGSNVRLEYYDYNSPLYLDTTIQSTYTDSGLGLRAEDIIVDGGAYYDTYSSHAPEELVPGIIFDSLNMVVSTKIKADTEIVSYRIEHNMITDPTVRIDTLPAHLVANIGKTMTDTYWPKYYRVSSNNTTTLSANLSITDSNVYVTDASVLMEPDLEALKPGFVYINGEKITYYTRDTVNNVLSGIRRAVDGTGAPLVHVAGLEVVDAAYTDLIPDDYSGNPLTLELRAHTGTWLNANVGSIAYQIVSDLDENIIDDNFNQLITTVAGAGDVTDGSGLEGSQTPQAKFIRGEL